MLTVYGGDSYSLNAIVCNTPLEILKLNCEEDEIAGIAQTKGTDGQLVKVALPNYIEEGN